MKKWKMKGLAGLLALTLVMPSYATTVSNEVEGTQESIGSTEDPTKQEFTEQELTGLEPTGQDSTDQKQSKQEHAVDVDVQLEIALQTFEAEGMINLYPNLSRREKKKWDKCINENNFFEPLSEGIYKIAGLYEMGENQYYILGKGEGIFQLVLMQEGDNYFATQVLYPSLTVWSSEEVALYKKVEQEASNVAIEYNKVRNLEGTEDYVGYLDEAIGDLDQGAINDHAKAEVTQYVQYALEELSTQSMETKNNNIEIGSELLEKMKEGLASAKSEFDNFLSEKDISFNKSLNAVLKLQMERVNFRKPIYLQLPKDFEDFGEATGLKIALDDKSYIYIDGTDFEAAAGLKIKIERQRDKKTYAITFLDEQDKEIEQLDYSVTFAFPAKDEFSTVVATFGEEEQNWGGQYETASHTIAFGTKYSGQYKIVDSTLKIKDIDQLPATQQSAIKFMVSKGYLSLDKDNFYPEASFTRYEFAEALVKMFFALDTSLTTTFKDVPTDSPYYHYVASGEVYDIINGYEDHTFKGDVKIPIEQVISLCARTIADKKGYVYPETIEDYIAFADSQDIAKWATKDIALAVQSGLITAGGSLAPKAEMTRADSAQILYNLFMLLHETAPEQVVEIPAAHKTYSILGVVLLALFAIVLIRRFIKRNKVILTLLICTAAIILTLIIGFKGGF